MKNRNFSALLLIIISLSCLTLTVGSQAAQQQDSLPLSVYVSALKGECLAGQDSGYVVTIRHSHLPPEQSLTPLEFFSEDSSTRNQIEDLFGKQKTLRVVRTPAEADFAFCVCTQFRGGDWRGYDRLGVTASAVSAKQFSRSPGSPGFLKAAAFWHKNNLSPAPTKRMSFGDGAANAGFLVYQDYVKTVLPKDLAKQFLADLPDLTKKIASLPKTSAFAGKPEPAKIWPGLDDPFTRIIPAEAAPIAGGDQDRVRIQTTLVTVPVTVLNKNNHALTGLKPQDFSIYEDNVKQELANFGQIQQPLHVVMMIDRSCNVGSVQGEDFKEAAMYFFNLLPLKSKMMVVSFSREVLVETEFTDDRKKLALAFSRRLNFASATQRFNDALEFVLTGLAQLKGRKAIVLLTNGNDRGSRLAGWKDPVKRLAEADVAVFPVDLFNFRSATTGLPLGLQSMVVAMASDRAEKLKKIAEETGGAYYRVPSIGDAPQTFASIAETLKQYYWLSYYPTNDTNDNRYRRIRVEINHPEAKVRTRKGYQAARTKLVTGQQSK